MNCGELLRFLNVRCLIKGIVISILAAAILLYGAHRIYAYSIFKDYVTPVYDLSKPVNSQEEQQP